MTNFAKELSLIKNNDAHVPERMRLIRANLIDNTVRRLSEIERHYVTRIMSFDTAADQRQGALEDMILEISMIEDDAIEGRACFLENKIRDLQCAGREREVAQCVEKLLAIYDLKITEHKLKLHTFKVIDRLYGKDKATSSMALEREYIYALEFMSDELKYVLTTMSQRKLKINVNDNDCFYYREAPILESVLQTRQRHTGC